MGYRSGVVIDLEFDFDGSIENRSTSELISMLKSSFRDADFAKVESILVEREEERKLELESTMQANDWLKEKLEESGMQKLKAENERNELIEREREAGSLIEFWKKKYEGLESRIRQLDADIMLLASADSHARASSHNGNNVVEETPAPAAPDQGQESWGLIKELEDRPLLQVETALVNASTCQDLMSPTNLVGSHLVDIAAGMDNKIFNAMTRKRSRVPSGSSNPPPPPKKTNVGPSKAPVHALPSPPPRKSGGEKSADKSSEVSTRSGDRSSPLPSRDQGDYLTPYQRDYGKSVGPKMVQDIESMSLTELAGFVQRVSFKLATIVFCYKNRITRHERKLQADNQDLKKIVESADRSKEKLLDLQRQVGDLEEKLAMAESNSTKLESELGDLRSDLQATQSERDTLKTALEGEIKSLNEQLAEVKGKYADVDDRIDAEYNSGLTFCYKCIMSVLKEEYPELEMNKLEAGVQRYMAEGDQGNKEHGDQGQVEAPLDVVQEGEAGDRVLEVGQGSVPTPPEAADPLLPEIAGPSTVEAAESHRP